MGPMTLLAALALAAPVAPIAERFEGAAPSPAVWRMELSAGASAQLEESPAGRALHLHAPRGGVAALRTRAALSCSAYTLEYAFFQPSAEARGYQAVVQHPHPGGHAFWWLEYGPERFFLYTAAGGVWYNRWSAPGLPADTWYRVRLRNTPGFVRVTILDRAGVRTMAESPAIPHDPGGPAPLSFSANADAKGEWGMKVADIRLSPTPMTERDEFRARADALNAAEAAVLSAEGRRLWPEGAARLADARAGLAAAARSVGDDPGAEQAFAALDQQLAEMAGGYSRRALAPALGPRDGWILADIRAAFDADSAGEALNLPGPGPLAQVRGIPFAFLGFGRNCVLQGMAERSARRIPLAASASRIGLLMAPLFDAELYARDDSLADVLQVELRYADGFRERVAPTPAGWRPAFGAALGQPPAPNRRAEAFEVIPGHRAPLREIAMLDRGVQAGWALLALSYRPGLPAASGLAAATRQRARRWTPPTGARVVRGAALAVELDATRGLVRRLEGRRSGATITPRSPSPLFAVRVGEAVQFSDSYSVRSMRRTATGGLAVELRGPVDVGALGVRVAIEPERGGGLTWRATLENRGAASAQARLVFPLLDGLDLGPGPSWFFPQRGGAASDVPAEALASYGGMAWMQMVQASRVGGGGLYLRSGDTTGEYKVMGLRSIWPGAEPRRWAEMPPQARPVIPWRASTGVHLSLQYVPPRLEPGARWSAPPALLRDRAGDWREALSDYRDWLASWWKPARPCPDGYRWGFYALVGGAPPADQRGEAFGSYDWWHLSPIWGIDYASELETGLAALSNDAARAAAWGQGAGLYIEGMCVEKSHRIAEQHGAAWAMKDEHGEYYTYYSNPSVPVWNMCPGVEPWRLWDAGTYAEIAGRTPLTALYIDSIGSRWSEFCFNPAHGHPSPAIWPRASGELFAAIRRAVRAANPGTAIHSEEPGCDFMAMREDGSWSHTLWTDVSGDPETNPAGLNYFRFAAPGFKMYEIPSYRHALWRCKLAFFNGEGLWTALPDAPRRELFVRWMPTLREHAGTFQSGDASPAIRIAPAPLTVNRFRCGPRAIYTALNAGLRTVRAAAAIDLPAPGRVTDLLTLREVAVRRRSGQAVMDLEADPHEALCLLAGPRLFRAERRGDRLRVTLLAPAPLGARWVVSAVDEAGARTPVAERAARGAGASFALPVGAGRALVRLATAHDTLDQICLAAPRAQEPAGRGGN